MAAPGEESTLWTSRGTCPICVESVRSRAIEAEGKVFLEKDCPAHGRHRSLLSLRADYFRDLAEAYFELLPESLPQRDYILRLTGRCNLECPICLAGANDFEEEDLSLDSIRTLLEGRRRLKLDLMGAEPTERDDLDKIIRLAKQGGHLTALHTNGVRIGEDPDYLDRLVRAGLSEVHLQCDGFNAEYDLVIRGRSMSEARARALAALERSDVATDLVVTILKGVNEDAMVDVLAYGADHPFVKEVFFLGCRRLGRAEQGFEERCLVPDELIELMEVRTRGRINREDIRVFQKLYFALLALFKVRKCFYIHHYMILREPGGYRPISAFIDLAYLEPRLDRFRRLLRRQRPLALLYLAVHGVIAVLRRRGVSLFVHGAALPLNLWLGFDLSRIRRKIVLLGFITACDPWIHDERVAANCGKGEISNDQGVQKSGADANVGRERDRRVEKGKGVW